MKIHVRFLVVLATVLCVGPAAHAQGFLDRIRQKAEEAVDSVRDVRDDVEEVTTADERAVSQVEREIDVATDVEGQARRAAADTELARTALDTAADAARVGTTDDRLEAEVRREAVAAERDVRNATDVTGAVERSARDTDAGRAVTRTEAEIAVIGQTDELVQATAERQVEDALGVSETRRGVRRTERSVRDTERALDELESTLE